MEPPRHNGGLVRWTYGGKIEFESLQSRISGHNEKPCELLFGRAAVSMARTFLGQP